MKRRIMAILLVIAMVSTFMMGCNKKAGTDGGNEAKTGKETSGNASGNTEGGKTFNGIDISEEVKLKMYLLGDRTTDFDTVYGEINKILKEKLNATVEVDFLSWSDHDTKYSLLFSGGDEFDLIFTASSWGHYEQTASMGGFYQLTEDFIKTYAPDIWNVVPEVAWSQATINDGIYMVPNYQNEFAANILAVRGDLMAKYGIEDITTWDGLKEYYEKIMENETGITPLGTQGSGLLYPYLLYKGVDTIGGTSKELFLYDMLDTENTDITLAYDWDGFTEYAKEVNEMFNKGFWSADSMATTEERQDGLLKGTAASMVWNLGSCKYYAAEANKEHPEWNVTLVDIASATPKGVNSYINNGVAINDNSKNKERAMMVLNEFYTNPQVFDLAMLGIEGTHYEAVGTDEFKLLDGNANFGADSNCNWGWTNMTIKRTETIENPTALDDKQAAITDKWNANVKVEHIYDGFTFDNSVVSSEMAAVDTVLTQYYDPIMYGMTGDVDTAIATLRSQLESAGIDKIYEEVTKQAKAFVDSKK